MAENTIREIVAPDGTQYEVHPDGSWAQYAWDNSFIRDDTSSGLYTDDEDGAAALAEARREVIAKLGL